MTGRSLIARVESKIREVEIARNGWIYLKEAARKGSLTLVHLHNLYPAAVFALKVKAQKSPQVAYTDHAPWWSSMRTLPWYSRLGMIGLTRLIASSFRYVSVTNSETRAAMLRHTGLGASQIRNIGIGIDHQTFDSRRVSDSVLTLVRSKYGVREDIPLVLNVGSISEAKGQHILLQAAKEIQNRLSFALVFVGSFTTYGAKTSEVQDRWFSSWVRTCGLSKLVKVYTAIPMEELLALYKLASVVVVPDLAQALPYSLLEAMAMEKVVVASRVGGIPDVVEEGKNGFLFPAGDPTKLAQTLEKALSATTCYGKEIGRAARRTVTERFGWETVAKRVYDFYKLVFQHSG